MPAAKKKATTTYKGIKTTYKDGMTTTQWTGRYGPKEHIAGMKDEAKKMGAEKKDIAAAKRGDKSYSAKSVSSKKDVATAGRLKAPKPKRLSRGDVEWQNQAQKFAAKNAKKPGTTSLEKPKPGADTTMYNRAYIEAKKDIASFKRGQAKSSIKKMGKKK